MDRSKSSTMKIYLRHELPFITVRLKHEEGKVTLPDVLIDTGSASTLISADIAIDLGLGPGPEDKIYTVRGIGGTEFVYEKFITRIEVGDIVAYNFKIQVGAMDYGFKINGILGMDFLIQNKIVIDTGKLILTVSKDG